MSTATVKTPTFPLGGILGVAFIILKLTGHIGWAWVWVLAPFWAPFALALVLLLIAGLLYGLGCALEGGQRKRQKERRELINRHFQQFKF